MAKVKKPARVTGERNKRKAARAGGRSGGAAKSTASGKGARKQAAPKRPLKKGKTTEAARKVRKAAPRVKQAAPKRKIAVAKKATPAARPAPAVTVAIKELDPQLKCGPGTSVQFLYRVDELVEGRRTPHLVFYDHHGWYCEHGRTCPAVGHAKKHNGQFARAS